MASGGGASLRLDGAPSMTARRASASARTLKILPATPARWHDLETLFGERGACGGCWCMAWRLPFEIWKRGKGAKNKAALRRLVKGGRPPGILGYLGREAVAWCAVAPRTEYSFLERSRVLRPIDTAPVWSISCLFVAKPHRRLGISARMLRAAAEFAAKRGASVVEGYPTIPYSGKVPDPFLWTGTLSAFERAGFVEAARRSPTRPMMRLDCTARRL